MIKYKLYSSSLRAEVCSDKDDWYKVSVDRSSDMNRNKLQPATISISGYGSVNPEIALDYAQVLTTAYNLSLIFNSPVFKFIINYTTPKSKESAQTELLANDTNQVRCFLNDEGVTEYTIVAKTKYC